MTLVSILLALAAEQWLSATWRRDSRRLYQRLLDVIERHFNAGEYRHGVVGALLAVVPPVLLSLLAYYLLYAVHPLLALVWNAVVLYFTMGFRQFSHAFGKVGEALRAEDLGRARTELAAWRGESGAELSSEEVARLAIERGLVDSHRFVFGPLFWFLLLPGPAGAVLYRTTELLAERWKTEPDSPTAGERELFSRFAGRLFHYIDWVPLRLTAMTFAVVGDFEDAVYCWRTQAREWRPFGEGIVLASGAGALGIRLGEPLRETGGGLVYRPEIGTGDPADGQLMPTAVGLVWRALVVWLVVVLLMTLANWAG